MSNYDSILKEKKTYEEVVTDKRPKPFPWLKIDLLCLTLILVISYIFYYKIVLAPDKIFLNDLKLLTDKYLGILEPLNLYQVTDDSYNFKGTINLNEKNYKFKLNRNVEELSLNLDFNGDMLDYYAISNQRYLKLSNFGEKYYQIADGDYLNMLYSLKKYLFDGLSDDKFIKRIYMNGTIPIVESNLVLSPEEIKKALNLDELANSYEVLFTFKNDAISNKIISMKIIINNLTTSERCVILYDNNNLIYKDDNDTFKFEFIEDNDNFRLNIYQNESDTPYSVLVGSEQEVGYRYTYNIIDRGYSININIKKDGNMTIYNMVSVIEKEDNTYNNNLVVTLEPSEDIDLENVDVSDVLNYKSLTEQEQNQYKLNLNNIIGDLRQFLEQHQ